MSITTAKVRTKVDPRVFKRIPWSDETGWWSFQIGHEVKSYGGEYGLASDLAVRHARRNEVDTITVLSRNYG